MWSLQRIFYKRKTRHFVDNMIMKYADIRLSKTRKAMQRRIKATGARVQAPDYGDRVDRLTSSCCQTESDRTSTWSLLPILDWEQTQSKKRHKQQQQQDEAHLYPWRMSETPTESEYGSGISSSRLTRLVEDEDNEIDHLLASLPVSESDPVEAAPMSITNQADKESGCSTVSSEVGDLSPTLSPSTTTEALLPRLRPTAPLHCVIPNCCDFFTSPHPHYRKEVIGMAKSEDSAPSGSVPTNAISPDTTNEGADNERDGIIIERLDNDRSDDARGDQEGGDDSDDSSVAQTNNEFEMWDYVCPQYARRYYANEWF